MSYELDKVHDLWIFMPMSKSVLLTVAAIVKAFGGTTKTAEWANSCPSMVSNWLAVDRIPNGWHYRIHLELAERGFLVDPRAFGIESKAKKKAALEPVALDQRRVA